MDRDRDLCNTEPLKLLKLILWSTVLPIFINVPDLLKNITYFGSCAFAKFFCSHYATITNCVYISK